MRVQMHCNSVHYSYWRITGSVPSIQTIIAQVPYLEDGYKILKNIAVPESIKQSVSAQGFPLYTAVSSKGVQLTLSTVKVQECFI